MTPRAELIYDHEVVISPEMGALVLLGETVAGHMPGIGAWEGIVEWLGDGDAVVLVESGSGAPKVKAGDRILLSWE